ncbi:MAG: HAD family hydrolase [Firmicutes bacterium]|nr:HAD family hydrolase [Erysipelotrichaceae bacterium]MDD7227157.1 HAD family hydrolase [Bacillota bacterium]MDY4973258.1 HAD family hydrolase [Erysipelotrichaceae bacterium]MDY5997283.1 HAD family hydrolase [Erysipelotrichaceae bacterium]
MIKAIYFDIDSTTYIHAIHDSPQSTKKAFKQLKENGYKLAICTSRSMAEMAKLPSHYFEYMDAIICLAGAQIYVDNKLVVNHPLDVSEAKEVLSYLDKNHITYRYSCTNKDNFLNQKDDDIAALFYRLYLMEPPVKTYDNEELVHILYYPNSEIEREHIRKLCHKNYHLDLYRACEITAPNINKGTAIIECAKYWNIKQDEIAAFGDANNDLPMIKEANIGIAMGNGSPLLKQAADYITDTIENDGVYKACVHFGWIKEEK